MRYHFLILCVVTCLSVFVFISCHRTVRHEDFLTYVKEYADKMVVEGRDKYGTEHTPLFAAVLDRETMQINPKRGFKSLEGVRNYDRSIGGSNPLEEIGLYRLLFELTKLTGDKIYRHEAEKSLKYFLSNCQSETTGLLAWGEHLFWDFGSENIGHVMDVDYHEADAWGLWDECYALNPNACYHFALGEWNHQVADQSNGDFSRHARWAIHAPERGMDFPRYAGQMIKRWAIAYKHGAYFDYQDREELMRAIIILVQRMEENLGTTKTGILPAFRGADYAWHDSNLEFARCLMVATSYLQEMNDVDKMFFDRMVTLALMQDLNFLSCRHAINNEMGFAVTIDTNTGQPRSRSTNRPYTVAWEKGYGFHTHASIANLCYERYLKLKHSHDSIAKRYHSLVLETANYYLGSTPDKQMQLTPSAFVDVIVLLLNSYQLFDNDEYLERAEYFGWKAVDLFLDDGLPLPKASNKHKHYETITGGANLMYVLLLLHQEICGQRNQH